MARNTHSLNPAAMASALQGVPQRLFMGMNDKVITSEVLRSYLAKVQPTCAEVHVIPADHWEGFDEAWSEFKDKPIECK